MIHYVPWRNLFERCGIDLIFDVGANAGQSYESFRWAGFQGPICSFEPNPEVFQRLQQHPGYDWQRFPYALSDHSGQAKFYITDDDNSNSLQRPLGRAVVKEIAVPVHRLDEFWRQQNFTAQKVFLKIDTEGHDQDVIKGATGILDRIQLIMVESPARPRYEGEATIPDMLKFMADLDFCLCRAEKNCYNTQAGMDTALDVVFARRELIP